MSQTSLGLSDQEFLEKDPAEFLSEESTEESETTLEDSAQDTSSEDLMDLWIQMVVVNIM